MTGAFGWSLTLHLQHFLVVLFLMAVLSENWKFPWNYFPTLILIFPPFKALLTALSVFRLKNQQCQHQVCFFNEKLEQFSPWRYFYFALLGLKNGKMETSEGTNPHFINCQIKLIAKGASISEVFLNIISIIKKYFEKPWRLHCLNALVSKMK